MTEERIMKGMIRTIVEKNNKNFGDKKQVYVKYGEHISIPTGKTYRRA